MLVKGALEDVRIIDQYADKKTGDIFVLAAFDLAALEAKKQAIVDAVFESIALGAEQLTRAMGGGKIDQSDITNVVGTLVDIIAMGRTRLGRDLKSKWRGPYRQLKNAVELLLECVEVASESGGPLAQPVQPGALSLKVACRGIPIVNAALTTTVAGGLANAPRTVATDGGGLVKARINQAFGKGELSIALAHDLSAIRNSNVLGEIKASPRGRFNMATLGPARVAMKVSGVKGANVGRISENIGAWLSQKFGAEIVKSGAQLEALARVNIENSVEVGGKFTQPLRW
jgi:hypothetical protein